MIISNYSSLRRPCVGLLLFIVVCGSIATVLRRHLYNYVFTSDRHTSNNLPRAEEPECPPFDPNMTPRHLFQAFFSLVKNSTWLKKSATHAPSFKHLHTMLFGPAAPNLYETWPNHFKMKTDPSYPHTSLTHSLFTNILKQVNIPVTFVVEVGSFMGKSAINIAHTLVNRKSESGFVLLCIDTWLGGLEHWTNEKLRQLMGIHHGRPIVYERFLANIIGNNLTNYVIPYSTTSLLGARFLLDKKLLPQIVYLDSAHLQGETYVELELYWLLVQEGGLLIGDDWGWPSVRCDVLRFTTSTKVNVTVIENTWYIKKTRSS